MRFIAGLRGVESVAEGIEKLELELLVDRSKSARIFILMKILGGDRHSSLADCLKQFV